MRMNAIGRSHITTNSGTGKPSRKFCLFTDSRNMNGNTRKKLMIAGDLRFVSILFIATPSKKRDIFG